MYCMNCRQELPEGAKFCFMCGTPLGAVSPKGTSSQEPINLDGSHTFVQIKCENCGAPLTIDSSMKIAHCAHCGTDFLVQDAVKELNVKGNVHVGNATININDSNEQGHRQNTENKLLQKAIEQLELPNPAYKNAGNLFDQMCQDYPKNYKGWLGAWLVYEFSGYTAKQYTGSKELLGNARNLCPNEIRSKLNTISVSFAQCEPWDIEHQINSKMSDIRQMENHIEYCRKSLPDNEKELHEKRAELDKIERDKSTGLPVGIAFILGGIILGFLISGFIGIAIALFGIAIGIISFIPLANDKNNTPTINRLENEVKNTQSAIKEWENKLNEKKNEIKELKERQVKSRQYFNQLLSILKS